MKRKYLIILAVIAILFAGCARAIYRQGKPFKPNRNQVTNCHTYWDVRR